MKTFRYYMRALHRDLGYLTVGLIFIYTLSGIVLIYRNTSFLKQTVVTEKQLKPALDAKSLSDALRLKGFQVKEESATTIVFNTGSYDRQSGLASYKAEQVVEPLNRFITLHKITSANYMHWPLILFSVLLLFLAISAFWMFKPGTRNFRRSLFFTAIGILVAVGILILI